MKRIIFTIIFVLVTNAIFAQYYMNIKKTDSSTVTISTSDISEITFTPPSCDVSTVSYEGKTYHTVSIGTQCWLKENLDVGTRISSALDQTNNSTIEKYCYNDDTANCTTYGGLYQWAEAVQYQNGATNTTSPSPAFTGNVQGICPTGWHIPTNAEYTTLGTFVSSDGNALKAVGQGTGDGAGTDSSGFSALLSGYRNFWNSNFVDLGNSTFFWSSSEYGDPSSVYQLDLGGYNGVFFQGTGQKTFGWSVRCLKDN